VTLLLASDGLSLGSAVDHHLGDAIRQLGNGGIDVHASRCHLLELLNEVSLGDIGLLHDGQRDGGRVLGRVVDGVRGSDEITLVRVSQQMAVVAVNVEARSIRGSDGDAKGVARSQNVGGVPEGEVGRVDGSLLHPQWGQATFSPTHADGRILEQSGLAGGVQVLNLHHEVGINGIGGHVDVREQGSSHRQLVVEHRRSEHNHISAQVGGGLIQGSARDIEIVASVAGNGVL
jgi:hypothetical protein